MTIRYNKSDLYAPKIKKKIIITKDIDQPKKDYLNIILFILLFIVILIYVFKIFF